MATTALSTDTLKAVEELARATLKFEHPNTPITESMIRQAVAKALAMMEKAASEHAAASRPRDEFTWTKALNGVMTIRHKAPIYVDTQAADVAMVRLLTGTQPGQYLVPVWQANAFVNMLSLGSTMRRAGATIWPCSGIEELRCPVGLTSVQFLFMAQNSRQSPDPNFNLAQLSLTLKELRALVPVPQNLFRSARPALDALLPSFFALGAAEAESICFHAPSTVDANSPMALMSAAGVTFVNCAGSANGGNIGVSDVLGMIETAAEKKLRFPWCWFASPRTFNRLFSLASTTSQLLLGPPTTAGGEWSLCGCPLYLDTAISNAESLGSGSAQSHLVLCSPQNIAIGDDGQLAFAASEDFSLESGDITIRLIRHLDIDYQPRAGFVILRGIN